MNQIFRVFTISLIVLSFVAFYQYNNRKLTSYCGTFTTDEDFVRQKAHFDQISRERKFAIKNEVSVNLMMFYIVPQITCPSVVRLGTPGDGGKWVCNPWRVPSNCNALSFGTRGDVSYENDLYEQTGGKCKVYAFDMNPENEQLFLPFNGTFTQAKISNQTNTNQSEWTILDITARYSLKKIDFFKIDIEGGEFTALQAFLDSNFLNDSVVCHLLIEIHFDISSWKHLQLTLEMKGFVMYYKEANYRDLTCHEFSYIHIKCLAEYGLDEKRIFMNNFI